MRKRNFPRGLKIVMFALMFTVVLFLLGFVVKALWNWLMPELFGWKMIGYWQAMGLMLLSKLLFGGFKTTGGGRGRRRLKERLAERWMEMTPEQREKFRQNFGNCVGGEPAADSKTGS